MPVPWISTCVFRVIEPLRKVEAKEEWINNVIIFMHIFILCLFSIYLKEYDDERLPLAHKSPFKFKRFKIVVPFIFFSSSQFRMLCMYVDRCFTHILYFIFSLLHERIYLFGGCLLIVWVSCFIDSPSCCIFKNISKSDIWKHNLQLDIR